jgi:hypothetical protein
VKVLLPALPVVSKNGTVPVIFVNDTVTGTYEADNSEVDNSEADNSEADESNESSVNSVMSASMTKTNKSIACAIILIFIPLVIFAIAFATRSSKSREGIEVSSACKLNSSNDIDIESQSTKANRKDLMLDRTDSNKSKRREHCYFTTVTNTDGLAMVIQITPGNHMMISPMRYKSIP